MKMGSMLGRAEYWFRYRVRYARNWIRGSRKATSGKAYASVAAWETVAQEGEFSFHREDEWRQTPDFMRQSGALFTHFGFHAEEWAGKTVLDLGAGSKLRTKYFSESRIAVIEPLADRFLSEISWSDLNEADSLHSVPAEQLVGELVGQVDLVISINVLDHCFDFAAIMVNVRKYLNSGGIAFLSFDKHTMTDDLHPLVLTEDTCVPLFRNAGLEVVRQSKGFADVLKGRQTYGDGPYALNYWLRVAPESAGFRN